MSLRDEVDELRRTERPVSRNFDEAGKTLQRRQVSSQAICTKHNLLACFTLSEQETDERLNCREHW